MFFNFKSKPAIRRYCRILFVLFLNILSTNVLKAQDSDDEDIVNLPDSIPKDRYYSYGYEQGEIFLINKTKQKGLVKFSGRVFFKEHEDAKRQKFDETTLTGFVLQQDTFIVGRSLYLNQRNLSTNNKTFLRRLKNGNAQLYKAVFNKHVGTSSYSYTNYYLRKGFESQFTLVPTAKKKFREVLSAYFIAHKELSKDILNGKYKFDDLELIIDIYNKK